MAKNKIIYGNTTLIDLTDATLGQNDGDKILNGQTAYGKDGEKITGTCPFNADTTDATAAASEVLSGKTFYGSNGAKQTGTMANRGGVQGEIDEVAEEYSIAEGYHDGSGKVKIADTEQAKIIPSNIKDGVQILGVTGTYTGEGVTAQTKSATPYTTAQSILPDTGYDYLAEVNVEAIYYNETANAYGTTVTIGKVAPSA